MNCYEFQENISSYIEKEISFHRIKQFDQHVDGCSECRETYGGVVSTIQALRNSEKIDVSDSFLTELQNQIKQTTSTPVSRLSKFFEGKRLFGFEPRYAIISVAAVTGIVILTLQLLLEMPEFTRESSTAVIEQSQPTVPIQLSQVKPLSQNPSINPETETKKDSLLFSGSAGKAKPSVEAKVNLVKSQQ